LDFGGGKERKKWTEMTEYSISLADSSDDDVLALRLKISQYNKFNTVGERLNNAKKQVCYYAQMARRRFPNVYFTCWVVYRVGLHKFIWRNCGRIS